VEEDKDLVILEDVEAPPAGPRMSTPTLLQPQYIRSPPTQAQFQTPVRQRSLSRNTLHRAVLIRSAQRAVLEAESAEREREQDEEEELEVLGAVAGDIESESDDDVVMYDNKADENVAMEVENDNESEDNEEEYDEEEEEGRGRSARKSVWRKSLERIWPFRSSSPGPQEEIDEEQDGNVCYACPLV
jgi:hypothetical protein